MIFPILAYLTAGIAILGTILGLIALLFAFVDGKYEHGLLCLGIGPCACLPWVYLVTMLYFLGYRRADPMQMPELAKAATSVP